MVAEGSTPGSRGPEDCSPVIRGDPAWDSPLRPRQMDLGFLVDCEGLVRGAPPPDMGPGAAGKAGRATS